MNTVEQRVVDQTGVTETFDIDMQGDASPKTNTRPTDISPRNGNLPPIFEALQEQPGQRLQSQGYPSKLL
jgi:uncharacterized protein (TIGR03435 family)